MTSIIKRDLAFYPSTKLVKSRLKIDRQHKSGVTKIKIDLAGGHNYLRWVILSEIVRQKKQLKRFMTCQGLKKTTASFNIMSNEQ